MQFFLFLDPVSCGFTTLNSLRLLLIFFFLFCSLFYKFFQTHQYALFSEIILRNAGKYFVRISVFNGIQLGKEYYIFVLYIYI